jgi:hypothetical protein
VADVRLDSDGIAALLKSSGVADVVGEFAETTATNARGAKPGADIVVDRYVTDRAAASVTIREPRARHWQVTEGILTRAAAGAGLEVKERR